MHNVRIHVGDEVLRVIERKFIVVETKLLLNKFMCRVLEEDTNISEHSCIANESESEKLFVKNDESQHTVKLFNCCLIFQKVI